MLINKWLQFILAAVWLMGVGWGAKILFVHENTPAKAAEPPQRWPSSSRLMHPSDRFTLVLLAHPNCPCTRASMAELEIIMAKLKGRVVAFVVFSKPQGNEAEIRESALWRKSASIPGVLPIYDAQGAESRRFDGEISGQTMLYDANGRLIFSGGITSARGHQGDNEGTDAIVRLISAGGAESRHSPVFGCALRDPNAKTLKEDASWKK